MSAEKNRRIDAIISKIQEKAVEMQCLVHDLREIMGEDDPESIERVNEILRKNQI